jgi:hypothetical protein
MRWRALSIMRRAAMMAPGPFETLEEASTDGKQCCFGVVWGALLKPHYRNKQLGRLGARLPGNGRLSLAAQLQFLIRKTVAFASGLRRRDDDGWRHYPEELRLAEESPHTPDDEIERLFITAAKDNEDFIRQITEWGLQ